MIKTLVEHLRESLIHYDLFGFVRVFLYSEFRALCALLLSFTIVLTLGKPTIRWLLKQKIGDNPEFYNRALNELMQRKANVPTMGGILICGSILASTVLLADLTSFYIQMGIICLLWLTLVGFWDDWLKLTSARRKPGSREGLYSAEKLLFQLGLAVILGLFIFDHGQNKFTSDPEQISLMSRALNLPFLKTWTSTINPKEALPSPDLIVLGKWTFVLLCIFVITGSSNAVNLTDGMDGLAGGTMSIVAFAFAVLAWIAGQEYQAKHLLVPYIPQADELAVMSAAMVGACLGFLWFNCHPAQVFMGDTGSLPLGGMIGYIAVVIRQEFLLLIVGGIFVLEAVSVMMQVGYFKFTKGKRIFKCAPIHHHFHLSGWTEQQVVVRFWLISAILAAVALATLKLR